MFALDNRLRILPWSLKAHIAEASYGFAVAAARRRRTTARER
jgi:hypothetical protein